MRCLLAMWLGLCLTASCSTGSAVDAGDASPPRPEWQEIEWLRPNTVDARVSTSDDRIIFYTLNFSGENKRFEAWRAVWTPDAGLFDETQIDRDEFESGSAHRFIANSSLGPSILITGEDGSPYATRTRSFSEGGSPTSTLFFECDYFSNPAIAGGGATPQGEAWAVHFPNAASCRRRCSGTVELWKRESDGGAVGPMCPFEPDLLSIGRLSYVSNYVAQFHPTRRLVGISGIPFFSFSADGGLAQYVITDGGSEFESIDGALFWPSGDDPPRRIGGQRRLTSDSQYYRSSIREWTWSDGGIITTPTPLDGLIDAVFAITEVSKGVFVHGCRPPPIEDGGTLARAKRWCVDRRFVLVSRDGRKVLSSVDFSVRYPEWIVQSKGQIFGFESSSFANENGNTRRRVSWTQIEP